MVLPLFVEGRVASLADGNMTVTGDVTIDQINSNNRPLYVGEQTTVAINTLTTVTTMSANGIKYITKVMCSGEDNGKWQIFIDNALKATLRTTNRNVEFEFNAPLKIFAAEVVDIKVTHYTDDSAADFQATIFGYSA